MIFANKFCLVLWFLSTNSGIAIFTLNSGIVIFANKFCLVLWFLPILPTNSGIAIFANKFWYCDFHLKFWYCDFYLKFWYCVNFYQQIPSGIVIFPNKFWYCGFYLKFWYIVIFTNNFCYDDFHLKFWYCDFYLVLVIWSRFLPCGSCWTRKFVTFEHSTSILHPTPLPWTSGCSNCIHIQYVIHTCMFNPNRIKQATPRFLVMSQQFPF